MIMNYLSQKFLYFTNYFFVKGTEEDKHKRKVSKYEMYFEEVYKILSWEDITQTLVSFLVVNFIFWIVVQWQVKFLGFLFSIILVIFICDSYFENKDLTGYEAKYVDAFEEICINPYDIIISLKTLRRENPSSFCIGMCIIFLFISFVAQNISGYVLIYLTILGIFFIPLGFKFIPDEYVKSFSEIIKSLTNTRGVLAEEELIPFISDKDFDQKDADLDSLLTDRTADSVSNSLISGMSAMPSFMDFVETQQDIREEDLLPSQHFHRKPTHTPDDLSSDSDSEQPDINFESSHFSEDTSSEEEKHLGKGLKFSSDFVDNASRKVISDAGSLGGVISNFATLGGAFVANALKSAVTTAPVQRKSSSSDSDFEIIDSDDVK
ncbi:unnamed protein product [Phaedon cochleariae]|uniref:RETREG1-3/ARL6IP-like N-terminal reticulon-homology domain-containing protein n=1 Tax=Phaedon cochleariae TaxID=80249 RepID=A0A9P0DQQ2_PHACE|nr:unnamed protein product [Phaedon cochleariae]